MSRLLSLSPRQDEFFDVSCIFSRRSGLEPFVSLEDKVGHSSSAVY